MSLTIEVKNSESVRVHLGGRLDTTTAPALDKELDLVLAASPRAVVFDLANLEYISSAGLRCIIRVKKAMAQSGGQTLLVNPQPSVRKVFEIVKAVPSQDIFGHDKNLDAYLDMLQNWLRGKGV